MRANTNFVQQALEEFKLAVSYLEKKISVADNLRGKDARLFWSEVRAEALADLRALKSYTCQLRILDASDYDSLRDSIARIHRGYSDSRDHFSIACWTATAIKDFKDRLQGRGLVVVASPLHHTNSQGELVDRVAQSSWNRGFTREQPPQLPGFWEVTPTYPPVTTGGFTLYDGFCGKGYN